MDQKIIKVMDSDEMFENLKNPTTKEEKDLWKRFYEEANKNGWSNGNYERADGNFIVEEDCLNEKSCSIIQDIELLRACFIHGNWCLGQSFLYLGGHKPICFTQQINGGDEWDTMRVWEDGTLSGFESITMSGFAKEEDKKETFKSFIEGLCSVKSKKEYYGK